MTTQAGQLSFLENANGVITVTNTTTSVSSSTGALVVNGGIGVAGNLFVGGNLNIGGSTNITITGSISTASNLGGGSAGQLVYQSAFGVSGYVGPGTAGQVLLSNGAAAPVYTNTASIVVGSSLNIAGGAAGSLPIQSGAGATTMLPIGTSGYVLQSNGTTATWVSTASLGIGGGSVGSISPYSSIFTITNATAASSTITGALQVVGGAGIGQSLYVGGSVIVTGQFSGAGTGLTGTAASLTAGSAGSVSNALTINNGGSGAASGSTFNGSGAVTISYNTVGAPSTGGANATGTWNIIAGTANIAGSVNNAVTFNNVGSGAASGSTFNGSGALTVSYNTVGAPSTGGANATGTWNIIAGTANIATSAGSVSNALTINNGGSGAASGSTFNGSSPVTISYNTVGAPSTGGTNATGTWNIVAGTANNANNLGGVAASSYLTAVKFGQIVVTTSITLSSTHYGANVLLNGSNLTITLPASAPSGTVISLSNISSTNVTLSYTGTNGSDGPSTLQPQNSIMLISDGGSPSYWRQYFGSPGYLTGGAGLGNTQINSLGVGTAASGTAGQVNATSFVGSGAGLTGFTSGQITTALGYTPLSVASPDLMIRLKEPSGVYFIATASTYVSRIVGFSTTERNTQGWSIVNTSSTSSYNSGYVTYFFTLYNSTTISLPAGNYYAEWDVAGANTYSNTTDTQQGYSYLYNVTDSVVIQSGTGFQTECNTYNTHHTAGRTYFTLSGTKTVQLMLSGTSSNSSGQYLFAPFSFDSGGLWPYAPGTGYGESATSEYATLRIWKS